MRKQLLVLSLSALCFSAGAQTIADFESLSLSKSDTFYVNYSTPGSDVGFANGLAHFPCIYDTVFGGYWVNGFAYSNMKDSITSGYGNQYAAKAGSGFAGSDQYTVAYGQTSVLHLTGTAIGKSVLGFYITNSTYAYNSMRDGDAFAKKFGGTTGSDSDWFKLTVKGYLAGALKTDSVVFYLADYRFGSPASDYLIKDWAWVNLLPLGHVDSLLFSLSSSDMGMFGMNTPAYFCMDNFITNETSVSIAERPASRAKIYPNPAADKLYIELDNEHVNTVVLSDYSGKLLATYPVTGNRIEVNTSLLLPGMYMLSLKGEHTANVPFVKQ